MRADTSCIRIAYICHLYIPVPSLEDFYVFLRQQLEYRPHGRHRFACLAYTGEYTTQAGTTVDCSTAELRRNAVKNIALKAHGYCTPNGRGCNAYGLYTRDSFTLVGRVYTACMRAAWALQGLGFLIVAVAFAVALERRTEETSEVPIAASFATGAPTPSMAHESMLVRSPAFDHEGVVPAKYTCDGEDLSPPIAIERVPSGTVSLALIVDDPDAPGGTWDHWVVFNIPTTLSRVGEGSEPEGVRGANSWGRLGYGGPCPPGGEHRYLFKVYALDTMLKLAPGATKAEVERAMEGHVLERTTLVGRYARGT